MNSISIPNTFVEVVIPQSPGTRSCPVSWLQLVRGGLAKRARQDVDGGLVLFGVLVNLRVGGKGHLCADSRLVIAPARGGRMLYQLRVCDYLFTHDMRDCALPTVCGTIKYILYVCVSSTLYM